ncbi:hypothetical protein BGZ68_008787 [Mortierella alpina]|nr:hypothetical protein BGZ68_008787 [Mortierella alpina]
MSHLAAVKVFKISELAILVTNHLTRSDLLACILVHRSWHEAIIPFLYDSVTIGEHYSPIPLETSLEEASWDGFKKHSHHMQALEIYSLSIQNISLFGSNCTSLSILRLEISGETGPQYALWAWGLLKLIANNPSISTLCLKSGTDSVVNGFDHHLVVLGVLRYMPGLKKLVIDGESMGQSSVDEILRCAYRLEELDVTMDRIYEDPIPEPSGPRVGFDLASHLADLSLKDLDDVNTQDEPYILDSLGRQCRQGSRLKKFSFTLKNRRKKGVVSSHASLLVRLCRSADYVQLSLKDEHTRDTGLQTLYDQVSHPMWCLKHLGIGSGNPSIMLKILRGSTLPLVSFRLQDGGFSDELLEVLLQVHGKSLQRVSIGKCQDFFLQTNVEKVLSRCPNLQSLDVFNCDQKLDPAMTEERQSRWICPDGRVFKVLTSEQPRFTFVIVEGISKPVYATKLAGTVMDGPWKHLDMMRTDQVSSRIRFVAN